MTSENKTDINGLRALASDIAAQYKVKGCVILFNNGDDGVRIGTDGLDNAEILYVSNLLTYYTLKREFEQTND
jgi:hypothetical protein